MKSLADGGIEIVVCRTRYPQGAEKRLIQRITGREVPPGGLPARGLRRVQRQHHPLRCMTPWWRAKPLTQRIVTLTGGALAEPATCWCPSAPPLEHLVGRGRRLQGETPTGSCWGGPMMGIAAYDLSACTIKGNNGVPLR